MKNLFKSILLLGLAGGVAGCSTVSVQHGTEKYDKPPGDQKHELKIAKSNVPVLIEGIGGNSSTTVDLVKGSLAESGFRVAPDGPFLTVRLKPSITQRDKFGNYYVFEGTCAIKILRVPADEVADKVVTVVGDRKLDAPQAKLSAEKKLAAECAAKANRLCETQLGGIDSVIVTIVGKTDWKQELFSQRMRKKKGVYLCRRIIDNGRMVQYRIVYSARIFTEGIDQAVKDELKTINMKDWFL